MMKFTEKLAKEQRFSMVGLSVEHDNHFLKNMYKKMGYKDWGKGAVIDSWIELDKNGKKKKVNEKCEYLVKKLGIN